MSSLTARVETRRTGVALYSVALAAGCRNRLVFTVCPLNSVIRKDTARNVPEPNAPAWPSEGRPMDTSTHEPKKSDWKDQTWELGKMLRVGLTDSHVHEGLLHGVVVGQVIMFWHQRQRQST
jgi:hypothetical protein